jgi:hypothetical protein
MFWPCTDWDDAVEEDAPVTFSHMISQHNDFHAILLLVGARYWCDTKLRDIFFVGGWATSPPRKTLHFPSGVTMFPAPNLLKRPADDQNFVFSRFENGTLTTRPQATV